MVHDWSAEDGVQVSVSRGDEVRVMQRMDNGWTLVRLLHTGITGLVPTTHISRSPAVPGSVA